MVVSSLVWWHYSGFQYCTTLFWNSRINIGPCSSLPHRFTERDLLQKKTKFWREKSLCIESLETHVLTLVWNVCLTSMCSIQHFPGDHSLHLAFESFFYPHPSPLYSSTDKSVWQPPGSIGMGVYICTFQFLFSVA